MPHNKVVPSANGPSDDGVASFIERFKHIICSSFLLTPSLSISFYESSPPADAPPANTHRDNSSQQPSFRVSGTRAASTSFVKECFVVPADAPTVAACYYSQTTVSANRRLPRLDAQGRKARNAALLSALFLIPPISKTWQLWFSTMLFVACLTWAFVLLLGHSSPDERVRFTLSHQTSADPSRSPTSLCNLRTSDELTSSEKAAIQRSVLAEVSSLIQAAQRFDVSINKAISAIQEVEIVSRGYKLTHPLPPISRIEASQPSTWSNVASPTRKRQAVAATFVPATGTLGRSLSGGGNGAPTIKRHRQRPLSLTLSSGRASPFDRVSGRASPAVSMEAGDLDLTQRLLTEQSTVALAAGKPTPPRLVELRKSVVMTLEETGAACDSSLKTLQMLADVEELALLHDLYALDSTPQDEVEEADASQAWSNGDSSALVEDSPGIEQDRKAWVATTPRNFGSNVRYGDISNTSEGVWRPESSPRTESLHHRRLSLVSDGGSVLDRHPRTTSSLSRRSSLVSEAGNISAYRSPRLNYISEKSTAPSGPNESGVAKRLSYVSNSSVATGSFDTRSPILRNSSIVSSTFTPPHSSAQTYSAATSPQSRATKRSSILGPNSIFALLGTSASGPPRAEPVSSLSLLSIKDKFERMHRTRRRWLCHLLALRLEMGPEIALADGGSLSAEEYWAAACSAISSLRSTFLAKDKSITTVVAKEMAGDFLKSSIDDINAKHIDSNNRSESQDGLLTVPNTLSVAMHPGIEDRLHAMMLSLRSLQSKIRVCAEDIQVKAPPGLHGIDDIAESIQLPPNKADDGGSVIQLQKTLDSMRDDLLGLSAEWEATVKLVNKEKRRSPSPAPSTDLESDVAKSNAARDLESPLEAEEDAAVPTHAANEDEPFQLFSEHPSKDNDDDSDLAELLLRSTSPNSLPPPGLEQVFESIAGMAGLSGRGVDGSKASRADRIEHNRRQRELYQEKQASEKAAYRRTMDPSSMMLELSDVIQSRKSEREHRHHSVLASTTAVAEAGFYQPTSSPSCTAAQDQPDAGTALALGSPLDLGSAGHEGVFGASHSYVVDDQAIMRRSLSSLDLARARALQSLEARASSRASSSASNTSEDGIESQSRVSDDFSFEPTALESVPEDDAATASMLPNGSPGGEGGSTSRKTTPKATQHALSTSGAQEATPVPDSPFDLGAQVAAYARRKAAAAKAQAQAMHASGSESSISSQV